MVLNGYSRFQIYRFHSTCVPKLWGNISHTKINCFWISVVYRSIVIPRYLWFTEIEQLLEINDMQKTGPIHRRLMDVQQLWCKSWCFQGLIVSVKHISWLFKLFTLLAAVSLISVKVSFDRYIASVTSVNCPSGVFSMATWYGI